MMKGFWGGNKVRVPHYRFMILWKYSGTFLGTFCFSCKVFTLTVGNLRFLRRQACSCLLSHTHFAQEKNDRWLCSERRQPSDRPCCKCISCSELSTSRSKPFNFPSGSFYGNGRGILLFSPSIVEAHLQLADVFYPKLNELKKKKPKVKWIQCPLL